LLEPVIKLASVRGCFRDDKDGAGSADTAGEDVLMWTELATPTAERVRQTYAVFGANAVGSNEMIGRTKSRVRSVKSHK
jgi:hypothetical protein